MAEDLLNDPKVETTDGDEFFGYAATDGRGAESDEAQGDEALEDLPDEGKPEPVEPVEPVEPAAPVDETPSAATPSAAPQYSEQDYATALGQVDKDLDALASKYELGEMEFSAYRNEERKLNDLRATFGATLAGIQTERANRERSWNDAVAGFLKDPDNEPFRSGGVLAPMMREVLERQFAKAKPGASYEDVLKASAAHVRSQLRSAIGLESSGKAGRATGTGSAADELKARRDKRLQASVATPARGSVGASQPDPYEGWAAS